MYSTFLNRPATFRNTLLNRRTSFEYPLLPMMGRPTHATRAPPETASRMNCVTRKLYASRQVLPGANAMFSPLGKRTEWKSFPPIITTTICGCSLSMSWRSFCGHG